jgi:hypothetical protein
MFSFPRRITGKALYPIGDHYASSRRRSSAFSRAEAGVMFAA